MEKVMGKTGAPIKYHMMMYNMVVQAVLLYGSEIWVVTDVMMVVMEGFHYRISIPIVVMTARKGNGG